MQMSTRSILSATPLLLWVVSCAPRSDTAASTEALLAGAERALGSGVDSVRTIWAAAAVTAPGGGFETRVASARDGRVRMTLGRSLIAGVDGGRGWRCDSLGQPGPLDPVTRSVVRGHDLHMLALAPTTWLADPEVRPGRRWGMDSVLTVEFTDELGAPLRLHFRLPDTLPVGLELINHTGRGPREVEVLFEAWEERAGLRLFRKAIFVHGTDRFEYDYRELTINTLGEDAFAPGCPVSASPGAG